MSRTEEGFSKIKSYLDSIQAVAADVPTNSKVLKSLIEINEEGSSEVAPFRGADATGTIRGKSPIRDLIGVKRKIANEISDKPPSSPRKVHVTSAGDEKLSA